MAEREVKISFTGDAALFKGPGLTSAVCSTISWRTLMMRRLPVTSWPRRTRSPTRRCAPTWPTCSAPPTCSRTRSDPRWSPRSNRSGGGQRLGAEVPEGRPAIDDIIVSSDQLAAAIKDTDDAASGGTGKVGAGFANIRREVDQTRSVVANFVGNAVQELPGIAGAMGPMNMALGQFAEYATEGNIQLAKFAPAIAGMAVAGAALQALPQILGDIGGAKQEAFDAKQVELFRGAVDKVPAALDDVTVAAQAPADKLKDNPWDLMVSQIDGALQLPLVPFFAEAGLTMDQFLAAVTGGEQGISRLKEALQAAGVEGMTYETIVAGAEQAQGNWNTTAKLAETLNRVLGTSTRDLADETRQ